MVVRQGRAFDLGRLEKLECAGSGSKMKGLRRRMPLFSSIADDTFKIDEAAISSQHDRKNIAPQNFGAHGAILNDMPIHQPPEHYVAGQRDPHYLVMPCPCFHHEFT
jgi:hypothetical protein